MSGSPQTKGEAIGLAAAPFIGAAGYTPAAAVAVGLDTDLIAFAAKVEALAVRSWAALTRRGDLEAEVDRLNPPHTEPVEPKASRFDTRYEDQPNGGFIMRRIPKPVDPAIDLALDQHAADLEAWNADRDRIERRIGFRAVDRMYTRLYRRLEAAVGELTPMTPTTLAGLVAKARVVAAIDPDDDDSLNEWEAALKTAVLHDVVRIGGAA